MEDFLKFFDKTVHDYPMRHDYPMHLEVNYCKICDWRILIYKKGCADDGTDLVIVDVQDCDMELCFAKAQVKLKEWLLEHEGGY